MSEKLINRNDSVEELKTRIFLIKDKLPSNWRHLFYSINPKYECTHGINKVNNVFSLRSTDEYITSELERISEEYLRNKGA